MPRNRGDYHKDMQQQRAELTALDGGGGKPHRMTVSRMAELLATRTHTARPSVTLSRNAKGDTQIEVVCPADTIEEASEAACKVYDEMCERYARSDT